MPNWKTISHSLTEMHNDHGRAAILVSGDNAFTQAVGGDTYIKDITTEKTEGMWEGRDLFGLGTTKKKKLLTVVLLNFLKTSIILLQ